MFRHFILRENGRSSYANRRLRCPRFILDRYPWNYLLEGVLQTPHKLRNGEYLTDIPRTSRLRPTCQCCSFKKRWSCLLNILAGHTSWDQPTNGDQKWKRWSLCPVVGLHWWANDCPSWGWDWRTKNWPPIWWLDAHLEPTYHELWATEGILEDDWSHHTVDLHHRPQLRQRCWTLCRIWRTCSSVRS